ncbi:NosD domain-containing protein [Pyrobaculum ferrireducens]|uniref:NosD-like protein n=1 Tax=Pyrobaculum ferrireducens TaxID=1104324 RepID=G7VIA0_9CREN|nr:NosD domain-containing protein [Pyrobaculum ferrireducens]AET32192.1 NosD-like protein [Pyrobaculum ferrireducens]
MRFFLLTFLAFFLVAGYVQNMIDSAPPNSTVYIPSGHYRERLVINKPLTIIGIGMPVIDGAGVGDVVVINNTRVTIIGVAVWNSGTLPEDAGIKVYNSDVALVNVVVNMSYNGIYLIRSRAYLSNITVIGLGLVRATNETFQRLMHEGGYHVTGFEDRGHAVYVFNSSAVVEKSRLLYSKDGVYLEHSTDVTIKGNTVMYGRYGVHSMYSRRVRVIGNTFMHNLVGVLLMYSQNLDVENNFIAKNRGVYVSEGITLIECDNVDIRGNKIFYHIYGLNVRYTPWRGDTYFVVYNNTIGFNYYGAVFDIYSGGNFTGNIFLDNMVQLAASGGARRVKARFYGNFWSDYVGDGNQPYVYASPLSDVSDVYLSIRFYAFGPSYAVMRYMGVSLPTYAKVTFVDESPRRAQPLRESAVGISPIWLVAAVLLAAPYVAMSVWTRR